MANPSSAERGNLMARDSSGNIVSVSQEEYVRGGYTRLSDAEEQEAAYGDRGAAAFGFGALRGSTLGLSDVVARGLGKSDYELEGLRRANAGASMAGEIGGAVATSFIPGAPAELIGKAGMATRAAVTGAIGEGVLARAAAAGLSSGVEGGLYGVGNAISDAALKNENRLAEHVVAGFGVGSVFGTSASLLASGAKAGAAVAKDVLFKGRGRASSPDVPVELSSAADDLAVATPSEVAAQPKRPTIKQLEDAAERLDDESAAFGKEDAEAFTGKASTKEGKTPGQVLEEEASKPDSAFWKMWDGFGFRRPTRAELGIRSMELTPNQTKRLDRANVLDAIGEKLTSDPLYQKTKNLDDIVGLVRLRHDESGKALNSALSELSAASTSDDLFNGYKLIARWNELASNLEKSGIAANKGLAKMVREHVDSFAEKVNAEGVKKTAGYAYGKKALPLEQVEVIRRGLDDWIPYESLAQNPAGKVKKQMRRILVEELSDTAEAIAKKYNKEDALVRLINAKRDYHLWSSVLPQAKDRLSTERTANRLFSLTDNIWGAGGLGVGLVTGQLWIPVAGALVNRWFRKNGPRVFAQAMWRAENNSAMRSAAKGFKARVDDFVDASYSQAEAPGPVGKSPMTQQLPESASAQAASIPPPALSAQLPAGKVLEAAGEAVPPRAGKIEKWIPLLHALSSKGANSLFAGHAALWMTVPEYRDAASEAGIASPDEQSGIKRASGALSVAQSMEEFDAEAEEAIGRFMSARPVSRQAKDMESLRDKYVRLAKDQMALGDNPDAAIKALSPGSELLDASPKLAQAAMLKARQAFQYLYDAAPKPPAVSGALAVDWKPTAEELASYGRKVNAVHNPKSVLESLASGVVTPEETQALKTIYPETYAALASRLQDALAERKTPLPYDRRLALSSFLGVDVPGTASGALLSIFKRGAALSEQKESTARMNFKTGQNKGQTNAQRIEGR